MSVTVDYCGIPLGTFESQDDAEFAMRRHEFAAVSEGLCPVHRSPLRSDGGCGPCVRRWFIATDPEPIVGWEERR